MDPLTRTDYLVPVPAWSGFEGNPLLLRAATGLLARIATSSDLLAAVALGGKNHVGLIMSICGYRRRW